MGFWCVSKGLRALRRSIGRVSYPIDYFLRCPGLRNVTSNVLTCTTNGNTIIIDPFPRIICRCYLGFLMLPEFVQNNYLQ